MKKFLSCLVSAGILASTVTAFAASSAFNPNKDPNGDGQITLADSAYILQVLAGKYIVEDLSEFDMDDNDVVSDVDEVYVRMYTAGLINTLNEPEVDPVAEFPTSSRGYHVYNAQTGTYNRRYSLTVTDLSNSIETNMTDLSDSVDTRQIFPPNEQISDWSNTGVAKIMSDATIYGYLGTGFVVGPHTIATAAHVVFDRDTNSTYNIDEILLFDENGSESSFTPVEIHTPINYIADNDVSDFDYDYSLITVEEDLSNYISFNLGAITDNAANKFTITTVGFPKYCYPDVNTVVNDQDDHTKYLSQGNITSVDSRGFYFGHNADTVTGNSGSPIYLVETLNGKTYNTVIGIHVGVYNTGLRFTPHVLKFFKGNTNIQY